MADLHQALNAALSSASDLNSSFQRLSARYREEVAATAPILQSAGDVVTYAAYRMPATFAAVRSALTEAALLQPGFAPVSQLDIGGGSGAAVWAAAEVFPSISSVTVYEQVPEAIALGKKLAMEADAAAVRGARWVRGFIDDLAGLEDVDLVTVSYVLSELSGEQQQELVGLLARSRAVVLLIEPGTPKGYERIVAARDALVAAGRSVVAPCPQDGACPIPRGKDWCHFSSRVNRSSLHRQTKGGVLGFEDEKFSYVVTASGANHPQNRVVRHPQSRKGMVSLRLCTGEGSLEERIVSKRQGPLYKAARDAEWGDAWPPVD
ncbi:small ribosomal subunit Rsm22 family protein [Kribbella sp. NPDC026611]|uniref:small ribosomal subunit Rsm22 family protein n=1 Tax=Kribbella sp. NPDC026611 TaxID=3154911 RepID=UPI0033C8CE6B